MPSVRSLCVGALAEIGVYAPGEVPTANDLALALQRFQFQFGAWNINRAALAIQRRIVFTLLSGTSEVTIGPGGDVVTTRPVWLDTVNYINPGSSPAQEVPVGIMTPDTFAALSIKELQSSLPLQCFYQTSVDSLVGTLFVYPQVTQNVEIVLYFPSGVGTPATLDDILLAPEGYDEAFLYQLAERLITPFAVRDPMVVARIDKHSEEAFARIKRPNLQPGQQGVDAALAPTGAGYNVYSDTYSGWSGR